MSVREVNALSHYTDRTIGHVHSGALGWVAFISFGYSIISFRSSPSQKDLLDAADLLAFWIATLGIVLYITSMWVAGIMQGLMWRAYDAQGFLQYSFAETVSPLHPFYILRALGGIAFLIGALIMVYNFWMTVHDEFTASAGA